MAPHMQGGPRPGPGTLLECVVNVSEGRDGALIAHLAGSGGSCLLDVHSDPDHNRTVVTLAGPAAAVESSVRELVSEAVAEIDIGRHTGAHPRFGVVDVVPWVALEGWPLRDPERPVKALDARLRFAQWVSGSLRLPVFFYGPERSLPAVRRDAWRSLRPDLGPAEPHPTAGSVAVGQRPLMVAYNLWLREPDLVPARQIASALRSPTVRAMAFLLGGKAQVSCNLLSPTRQGPAEVHDYVASRTPIERAELVGLLPAAVLAKVPEDRWAELDLSADRTIEERLERRSPLPIAK